MFVDCPSYPYEVDEIEIPKLLDISLPTVSDNSGVEPAITYSPTNFKNPFIVSEVRV